MKVKKTSPTVDNLTENEKKRLILLTKIQEMVHSNYKYADIASVLGISTRTVIRYKDCNPLEQCQLKRPSRNQEIYQYKDEILHLIMDGYHASSIAPILQKKGCKLGTSTIKRYVKKYADEYEIDISKNRKGPVSKNKEQLQKIKAETIVIKKQDLMKLLWMNTKISSIELADICSQYPVVHKLKTCINDFRQIFNRKNMPLLYLFIERYKNSEFAPIASFANGLLRDIEAVENAVASPLSNGFVEGINSRTKMIKRVMYGRCGLEFLSAKIMLPYAKTDICGRTQTRDLKTS